MQLLSILRITINYGMMKLYDVPEGSKIRVLTTGAPPFAPEIAKDDILYFDHIDGMYSYCKDSEGNVVHLVAWAEVEIIT